MKKHNLLPGNICLLIPSEEETIGINKWMTTDIRISSKQQFVNS
jgi:hypothetical protein